MEKIIVELNDCHRSFYSTTSAAGVCGSIHQAARPCEDGWQRPPATVGVGVASGQK